jgi:hypothetical protein
MSGPGTVSVTTACISLPARLCGNARSAALPCRAEAPAIKTVSASKIPFMAAYNRRATRQQWNSNPPLPVPRVLRHHQVAAALEVAANLGRRCLPHHA